MIKRIWLGLLIVISIIMIIMINTKSAQTETNLSCDPSYPDVCIPSPPPKLTCRDVSFRGFRVLPPDPHQFNTYGDGVGCPKREATRASSEGECRDGCLPDDYRWYPRRMLCDCIEPNQPYYKSPYL